jgi:hypothetical protein
VSDCDSQYDDVCKDQFEGSHRKLDRLDEAIRGNGRPGVVLRIDRLEQTARRYARLAWLIVGSALTSVAAMLVAWITG